MNNKNLFTIGEIAKFIGITRKIILNYEAKGLIKPDKKDGNSGNRYYTIDTFTQIRTIRLFQNLGLSLDEIHKYFNDNTDLLPMIKHLEDMRDKLNIAIEKLKERNNTTNNTVKEISIEAQTIYFHTSDTSTTEEKTNLLRNTALEAIRIYGTDTTRRMYFTEYSEETPQKISYCVALPQNSKGKFVKQLPKIRAISAFHHGTYESIHETRKILLKYAKENNIELSGIFRNLYFEGPPSIKIKANL